MENRRRPQSSQSKSLYSIYTKINVIVCGHYTSFSLDNKVLNSDPSTTKN